MKFFDDHPVIFPLALLVVFGVVLANVRNALQLSEGVSGFLAIGLLFAVFVIPDKVNAARRSRAEIHLTTTSEIRQLKARLADLEQEKRDRGGQGTPTP